MLQRPVEGYGFASVSNQSVPGGQAASSYAEERQGNRFSNAYATRSADWGEFLECQIGGIPEVR